MNRFDQEVEQRSAELRAEDREDAERERTEAEEMRQAAEALAELIERKVGSRRLVFTVVPADETLDAFAKFVIEIRHRRTDVVLGHVLQRDVGGLSRFDPSDDEPAEPAEQRIASFFAPLVLYRECEFEGYACESPDELDPRQFDEKAFVDALYDELVELTAAHEQEHRD